MSLKHEVLHAIYPKGIPTDHIGEKLDRIQSLAEAIERVYSGKRPIAPKAPVGEKPAYVDKIAELRKNGLTYEEIAVALQAENIVISGSQVEKRIRRYHPELLGKYEEWRKAREESGLPPVERGPPIRERIAEAPKSEPATLRNIATEDYAGLRSAAGTTEATPLEPEPVRTGSELPCSAGTANNIAAPIESEKAEDVTYSEATKEVNPGPSEQKVEQVAEPPALQEAKPEQIENPTVQENQIVEKAEEEKPKATTLEADAKTNPDESRKLVYKLSDDGMTVKGISQELSRLGIECPWEKVRAMLACRARNESRTEDSSEKPEPKAISRANLEGMIYDMHTKEHLTPAEISDRLYAQGLYYSEKTVKVRLQKLGVDI